jgi:hypothetical protein
MPALIERAIAANDRVKYLIALLQGARLRADDPEGEFATLRAERVAAARQERAVLASDGRRTTRMQRSRDAARHRLPRSAGCARAPGRRGGGGCSHLTRRS